MKVSVFGANGYIGKRLVKLLNTEECRVDEFTSENNNSFDKNTGVIEDLSDVSIKTDVVVYLSQSPYYRQIPERIEHVWGVNVISAIKVAEWARKCGAKRFIYTSTGSVYMPEFLPHKEESPLRRDDWYALSKLHGEEALSLFRDEMSITCARLFGVYGPDQKDKLVVKLISSIKNNKSIDIQTNVNDPSDCDGLRLSLCYIDDVVKIIFKLCYLDGPEVINVSSKEVKSIRQISEAIGRHMGIIPNYIISDAARDFDLIADVSMLMDLMNLEFTDFETGLEKIINL